MSFDGASTRSVGRALIGRVPEILKRRIARTSFDPPVESANGARVTPSGLVHRSRTVAARPLVCTRAVNAKVAAGQVPCPDAGATVTDAALTSSPGADARSAAIAYQVRDA